MLTKLNCLCYANSVLRHILNFHLMQGKAVNILNSESLWSERYSRWLNFCLHMRARLTYHTVVPWNSASLGGIGPRDTVLTIEFPTDFPFPSRPISQFSERLRYSGCNKYLQETIWGGGLIRRQMGAVEHFSKEGLQATCWTVTQSR